MYMRWDSSHNDHLDQLERGAVEQCLVFSRLEWLFCRPRDDLLSFLFTHCFPIGLELRIKWCSVGIQAIGEGCPLFVIIIIRVVVVVVVGHGEIGFWLMWDCGVLVVFT